MTRPHFIFLGYKTGLLLAFGSLAFSQLPPTHLTKTISPVFQKYKVLVACGDEAEGVSTLNKALGEDIVSQLRTILPFLLVVQNNNTEGRAIVRLISRVDRFTPAGELIPGISSVQMPGSGIRNGELFILTPSGEMTQALNAKARGKVTSIDVAELQKRALARIDSSRFPKAEVSLDSVVFNDGTVLGPDRFGVVDQQTARIRAQSLIADKVLDDTLSDLALSQWLKQVGHRGPVFKPGSKTEQDHYQTAFGSFAVAIDQQLNDIGRQRLKKYVSDLKAQLSLERAFTSFKE